MDQLRAMEAFVRVGKSESFTVAAEQLGISRALVSKLILQLEQSLGVRLLNRTTRKVRLSDIGATYYEFCTRILAEIEDVKRALGKAQSEPRGTLRILAPQSFGVLQLAPAMAAFKDLYPEIEIAITLNDHMIDLVENGLDVGLHIGPLAPSSMMARLICNMPWVTCAAPRYLKSHPAPKHPRDLLRHVGLSHAHLMPNMTWSYREPSGKTITVKMERSHVSNSVAVLRELALAGFGVALMPSFAVAGDIKRGRLKSLLQDYAPPPLPFHAVYPPNRYLAAKVRVFIDFLAAHFAQGRWR